MWKFTKWFFGITIVLSVIVSVATSINETQKLDTLRETDPIAYLEALKAKDELQWMLALKDLEPERYSTELGHQVAAARAIPAEETYQNLQAYRKLLKLEPDSELFAQKVEYYEQALKEAKDRSKLCNANRKSDAYVYAKEAVRLQLKSPRSAKFGSYGQTDIQLYGGCVFIIKGYVDAQNGFGALLRSQYEVRLMAEQSGWKLINVDVK